jgi:hypothetical protein
MTLPGEEEIGAVISSTQGEGLVLVRPWLELRSLVCGNSNPYDGNDFVMRNSPLCPVMFYFSSLNTTKA